MTPDELNDLSGRVIDAAMRVHSRLGPGLLESAYEACLAYELRKRGISVRTQVPMPVTYDGVHLDVGYRIDMLAEEALVLELKAVSKKDPVHESQLISHLRLGDFRLGLLLNFHVARFRDGITRIANGL